MGLRVAVASGNWSNPATWNGGVLPTLGDIVASNTYTVTIDQNINVNTLTNAAQAVAGAVPDMTSNTTPSGVVDASINLTGLYAAYKAFGGDFNTEWNGGDGDWISYEFTTPKAIDQYTFSSYSNKYSWNFEAWDGASWVVIHSVSGYNSASYTSPLIGNSTPYIKYRIVFLTGFNGGAYRVHTIQFYEYLGTSAATAGGGFILNDGVTVTCTGSGVVTGTTSTCLTYSGSGVSTINANIFPANASAASNVSGLIYSGSGTLNLNGNIQNIGISVTRGPTVLFSGTGILNYTGTIIGLQVNTGLSITNTGTCNIVGDIFPGNAGAAITISGNAIVNITGNIFPFTGGSSFIALVNITALSAVVNMTGNVFSPNINSIAHGFNLSSNSTLIVVGNVYGTLNSSYSGINATGNSYIKVIGTIQAASGRAGLVSTGTSAINILTGPFISDSSGIQPIYVTRMHYQRTMGSYYEFRDNSTNGALPPAGAAPATRLVSPDTVVDAPIPANVRQGVVYASGSQTGTMIVPSPSNVANNVPVDNTLGTAVLDPNAIWAVPLTSINTLNSIGRRVKNAATVETTGAQIQQTLNNNE